MAATTEDELLAQFEELITGLAKTMGDQAVRPALEGAMRHWREHAEKLLQAHLGRVEGKFENAQQSTDHRLAELNDHLRSIERQLAGLTAAVDDILFWVKHRRDFVRLQQRYGRGE